MKNIIAILLILILPVCLYLYLRNNSYNYSVVATENTKPSVISFTSSMCLDCKKMKSVLAEVEPLYTDKINFIHINALDKNRKVKEYIKKYSVVLVPTLVFLDTNGNETGKIEGAIPKEELIKEIEEKINE